MTSAADLQFDELLEMVRNWPLTHSDSKTCILIKGAKEVLESPMIIASWRMLMCDHSMSFLLRPVVIIAFNVVNTQVMNNL
jgi:hypothetical protein